MSEDDTAAPVNQETPTGPDAAPLGDTQQEIDYQKRYNDLRAEFDRRNSESPEETLARLGYEQVSEANEDSEYDYDDEPEEPFRDPRVDQLLAEREAEREQAQQQQVANAEIGFVVAELDGLPTKLSDDDRELVGELSRTTKFRDAQGRPDVKAAYEQLFEGFTKRRKDEWAEQKKADQAPFGTSGEQVPDLDNPRERVDYAAARIAAMEADN